MSIHRAKRIKCGCKRKFNSMKAFKQHWNSLVVNIYHLRHQMVNGRLKAI